MRSISLLAALSVALFAGHASACPVQVQSSFAVVAPQVAYVQQQAVAVQAVAPLAVQSYAMPQVQAFAAPQVYAAPLAVQSFALVPQVAIVEQVRVVHQRIHVFGGKPHHH